MAKRMCITGAGGYVGGLLAKFLQNEGFHVVLLDIRAPDTKDLDPDLTTTIQGSVTHYETMANAIAGCTAVFHIAAFGMTGAGALHPKQIYEVNVNGTENVLKACLEEGCPYLIDVSTSDVVFSNQVILNGDETMPYLEPEKHPDNYGPTKTIAEKLCLMANHTSLKKPGPSDEKTLLSTAVRFHGIYGPGEPHVTDRMIDAFKTGLIVMTYGNSKGTQIQFGSGVNCVQGLWKAYMGLQKEKKRVAAGQAYFIIDGPPADSILFWQPLIDVLGVTQPFFRVPYYPMYVAGFLFEYMYRIFGMNPPLIRKDVNHMAITHTFSIEKARKDLGYEPERPNDLTEIIEHYKLKDFKRDDTILRTVILVFVSFILLLLVWIFWA